MSRISPALQLALNATPTQKDWAILLKSMLGNSPRIRCYRDAAANAPDPAATGVEFLNFAISGIVISGYKISSYGTASNITVQQAADLASGTSVLRIEGNGHWVEYSVGLPGSGKEYIFTANPTAAAGVATNMGMLPPSMKPSGTGYYPPALDADAPSYLIIWKWLNGVKTTEAGRIPFNRRIKNVVFEDTEYAGEMGDWRAYLSNTMVTYNRHEFGALMFAGDSQVGTVNGKTRYEVLCNFKPTEANWAGYPTLPGFQTASRTLNGATQSYAVTDTFMDAFTIDVMTADNRKLGTLDMPKDNMAINGEVSEVPTTVKPLRLNMHCGSMLMWESHPAKINSKAKKYVPGIEARFMRLSLMAQPGSSNPMFPAYPNNTSFKQVDGINQWRAMEKWALPANKTLVDAAMARRAARDPYLYNTESGPRGLITPAWAKFWNVPAGEYGSGFNYGIEYLNGLGYEPGAYCGRDADYGYGGIRFDRAVICTQHMIHMTDSTWVHPASQMTIGEIVWNQNKSYLNDAVHLFTDVKNFTSVSVKEVLNNDWAHYGVYYNSEAQAKAPNKLIPMYAITEYTGFSNEIPHGGGLTDAKGRHVWNGYSIDWFHNYSGVGIAALNYCSPGLALSNKFRYLASCMSMFNYNMASGTFFMIRASAWIFKNEAEAWKLAADHELFIPRKEVEDRIERLLMQMYPIYQELYVNNNQAMYYRVLRTFGIATNGGSTASWSLHYYMGTALMLWKQFGLFKVMCDKSPACKAVLLMIIKLLDKGCIDYYLDTDGTYSGDVYNAGASFWVGARYDGTTNPNAELAANWVDWSARVSPKLGPQHDLVHNGSGAVVSPDIGEWERMRWPFIRRDYFADIPSDRDVAACCTKVDGWIAALDARTAAATTPRAKSNADMSVHPGAAKLLPPTVLGD